MNACNMKIYGIQKRYISLKRSLKVCALLCLEYIGKKLSVITQNVKIFSSIKEAFPTVMNKRSLHK